jgi:hypothetical protein
MDAACARVSARLPHCYRATFLTSAAVLVASKLSRQCSIDCRQPAKNLVECDWIVADPHSPVARSGKSSVSSCQRSSSVYRPDVSRISLGATLTSVSSDGRSSGKAGFFGRQHHVQGGQFCRLSGPTKRRVLAEFCDFARQLTACDLQRRSDGTGRHHVDPDTLVGELLRQPLCENED